jgi:S1-C subfamily serine protease
MLKNLLNRIKLQYFIIALASILGSSLVAAILGFVMIKAGNIHNHLLRTSVGNAVVKVSVPSKGGGSGFSTKAASGRIVIVTNEHVCAISEDGWMLIEHDNGLKSKKKILHIDDQHDLCVLEGDFRLPTLSIGDQPAKGDFHYIVGHPGGRALTVSQGEYIGNERVSLLDNTAATREECKHKVIELNIIEQFIYGREFICLKSFLSYSSSAVAYGGNSGSPVVDVYGKVIGVLFAGSREQEHNTAIVPVNYLRRVLSIL